MGLIVVPNEEELSFPTKEAYLSEMETILRNENGLHALAIFDIDQFKAWYHKFGRRQREVVVNGILDHLREGNPLYHARIYWDCFVTLVEGEEGSVTNRVAEIINQVKETTFPLCSEALEKPGKYMRQTNVTFKGQVIGVLDPQKVTMHAGICIFEPGAPLEGILAMSSAALEDAREMPITEQPRYKVHHWDARWDNL
ncbi:hypothetical protein J4457_02980 [Candidatus Woesearchaeota archaeon]|nr:hypothetical protein [Candidatus Woesearchaeota archaeon]